MAKAVKYAPQGMGLNEPGANKASNPKPGSKNAKSINPNKSTGQLDAAIGKGPDASYQKFAAQQLAQKQQQQKNAGSGVTPPKPGTPPTQGSFKVPAPAKPANPAPKGILGKITTYAKAAVTSPGATIKDIRTGQGIKEVDNGAIIVNRMSQQDSAAVKKSDGKNNKNFKLDHSQSLEIGGDNNRKNLKDVPTDKWKSYTPVENYLGGQLKANKINAQQAKQLMADFKSGKISAEDVVNKSKGMPKGASLTSKIVKTGKSVGSAATSSEQALAKPIARLLPGGQNDLKAENAQIDQNIKATQQANKMIQSGDPKQVTLGKKLLAENKKNIAETSKTVKATADEIKTDTSTKRIVAGTVGTAADILTAGTVKAGKAGLTSAKELTPVIKGTSLLSKTARAGGQAAGFGTAGAANSASAGGDKKQIAENFVAGAALPGILHVAGKGVTAAADKAVGGQATKDLVTNTKTRSLLSAGKPQTADLKINAQVNPDHVVQGLVHPDVKEMPISKINIAADAVSKPDAAKVNQYVKQIKDGETIEPVVVQHIDGHTFVVDGQSKLAAARKLGIENVPTVEKVPGKPGVVEPAQAGTKAAAAAPAPAVEGSIPKAGGAAPAAPVEPAPIDTAAIKEQIKAVRNEDKNYDPNGNITPEAGKQLTALHKQLNAAGERVPKSEKPVTVTPIESTPRVESPNIKTSKLAQGVEHNAIKKGLTEGFADKSEYAGVKIDQQAKSAADLIKSDPDRAVRIAMGHERPPEDLLPESVFIAVENAATKAGDTQLIKRLATESHLTSEASGMGQRIRMLGERDTHSAVTAIKKVSDARAAAIEKRTGKTATKAVNDEVRQIRAAKPKVTKETWGSFIDTLKC